MRKAVLMMVLVALAGSVSAQDSMMKTGKGSSDGSMMKAGTDKSAYDLRGLGPQVVAFTTEKAAQALAAQGTAVYFFAATWCPDCQATYRDIQAQYRTIPGDFTLIFVNYDKSGDLKKKYGITSQHTFVSIGPGGEKLKVWSGTTTVASLLEKARR